MSRIAFQLPTIVSCLENEHCLGRLLFFSQATAYGENADEVRAGTAAASRNRCCRNCRCWTCIVTVRQLTCKYEKSAIEVPPPPTRLWSHSFPMRFHAVCWDHQNQASIAYCRVWTLRSWRAVRKSLERQITDHVRFALMRRKAIGCLRELIWLQRAESVDVQSVSELVEIAYCPASRAAA